MTSSERQLEELLVQQLRDLKYDHRADIRDRAALERNFREKFQALNRVKLTDASSSVFSTRSSLRCLQRRQDPPRD
jgi:type I restriction enzyme R subunit